MATNNQGGYQGTGQYGTFGGVTYNPPSPGNPYGSATPASGGGSGGGGGGALPTYDAQGGFTAGGQYFAPNSIQAINSRMYGAITPESQKPTQPFQPFQQQPIADLLPALRQTYFNEDGTPKNTMQMTDAYNQNMQTSFNQQIQMLMDLDANRKTSEQSFREAQRESGFLQAQKQVADLSAQLNMITARGQQAQIGVVGQGRGIPEAIIGGQQAQIARETSIEALPVAAQLSAAQGNMEMAQQQMNMLFQVKTADAKAEYDFKTSIANKLFDFASEREKTMLSAAVKMEERQYNETQQNYQDAQRYAGMALQNNQGKLAGDFMKLDHNSPTFKADLAKLIPKVYDPVKDLERQIKNQQLANLKAESEYSVMGLTEEQNSMLNTLKLAPHQKEMVAGIMSGIQPPITSIQRTPEVNKVLGALSKLGYDNTTAVQDWTEMQKRINTMSSKDFVRLENSIRALEGSVGQARRLYQDWQDTGLPSGFSSYNKAALQLAAKTPGEKGVAARTLISHIEDMNNELSVVYRLGNTPTDKSLESAARSLNANWNSAQFEKNLQLIEQNMRIRTNSLRQSANLPSNIYNRPMPELQNIQGQQAPTLKNTFWNMFDNLKNNNNFGNYPLN
jgi:hypothetical protein